MKETSKKRYARIYVSSNLSSILTQSCILNSDNILGKTHYYYNVIANNRESHKDLVEASKKLLVFLQESYVPEHWVKGEEEEDAQRFGYSSMFMMSKYHYVISLEHDLEKKTIVVSPYKWANGTQEAFKDMETYTLSDTCTAEELSEALKKAYTFLESYSPIPEKYRTQPLNRDKVIAKWRKEHADDSRVAIDIAKEKEISN